MAMRRSDDAERSGVGSRDVVDHVTLEATACETELQITAHLLQSRNKPTDDSHFIITVILRAVKKDRHYRQ